MSEWRIPLSDLDYDASEEEAVLRVLRGKWLSMGPEVQAFEHEFAELVGARHCVAVSNGTAALHLAYLALGLGRGDDIIQPALNFVAAANMTVAVGAEPVCADIVSLDEPTIDPEDIERRITSRTKAVVVMHYGGYPCRMAEIQAICRRHQLALIEDACHAVGARYVDQEERVPHNACVGNLGDVACFSFFSNKNIAMGEGGMVVTNRDDLAKRLRLLRSHGMTTLTWDRHRGHASGYDVVEHGFNYRLDELHAALGRAQLGKLQANNLRRRDFVLEYRRQLASLSGWVLPFVSYEGDSAYHLMVIVAPDTETRKRVANGLREAGIQTSMHYPYVPNFQAFSASGTSEATNSIRFAERAITLPLYPTLGMEKVHLVASAVLDSLRPAALSY